MARGLATLIAAIGAGTAGYMKGKRQNELDEEDRADRAQQRELRQMQVDAAKAEQKYTKDLGASQEDIAVEQGLTTTGTNVYQNPDDAAYDAKEMATMTRQAPPPVAAAGAAPQEFAPKPIARVGSMVYGDPNQAQAAVQGVNSAQAKAERAAAVAGKAGKIEQQMKFQEYAKKALDEGTDKVLTNIIGTQSQLEQLKANGGRAIRGIDKDTADVFNKTGGKWKMDDKVQVEDFITKDSYGNEVVNSRVIGADGRPIVEDVRMAQRFLLSVKDQMTIKNDEAKAGYTVKKDEADMKFNREKEASLVEDRKADNTRQDRLTNAQIGNLAADNRRLDAAAKEGKRDLLKEAYERGDITDEEYKEGRRNKAGVKSTEKSEIDRTVAEGVKSGLITKAEGDIVLRSKKFGLTGSDGMEAERKELRKTFVTEKLKNNPEMTEVQAVQMFDNLVIAPKVLAAEGAYESQIKAANGDPAKIRIANDEFAQVGGSPSAAAKIAQANGIDLKAIERQQKKMDAKAKSTAATAAATGTITPPQPKSGEQPGVDVRNHPTLVALNAQIAEAQKIADPAEKSQRLMVLGTAKNAQLKALQSKYGSMTKLVTE